jgi:hypothetical protein
MMTEFLLKVFYILSIKRPSSPMAFSIYCIALILFILYSNICYKSSCIEIQIALKARLNANDLIFFEIFEAALNKTEIREVFHLAPGKKFILRLHAYVPFYELIAKIYGQDQ